MGKVQFLAEQKSGSAAGTNTRLLPTAVKTSMFYPSSVRCNGALRFAALQSHVKGGFAAVSRWRVKQYLCPAGRPSRESARQPSHFSCFAKRSNQEKATPMMAVPAARGLQCVREGAQPAGCKSLSG